VQLVTAVLLHVPAVQTSSVAGLPSLQFALVAQQPGVGAYACVHPAGFAQESFVQALESSQLGAVPGTHACAEQSSSPLQGLPSAQSALRLQQPPIVACWQVLALHVSVVHTSPSSHSAFVVQLEVVKLQIGPVTVEVPSFTWTYHSWSWFDVRPGQETQVCVPLGTFVFVPIVWNGRPASMS